MTWVDAGGGVMTWVIVGTLLLLVSLLTYCTRELRIHKPRSQVINRIDDDALAGALQAAGYLEPLPPHRPPVRRHARRKEHQP